MTRLARDRRYPHLDASVSSLVAAVAASLVAAASLMLP